MSDENNSENRRSLGRPPMDKDEVRTRRTVTFLTDSEYKDLAEIARRNNMSISSLAHKLLIQSLNSWNRGIVK